MKYAWIENDVVRDLAFNPNLQFHSSIASFYSVEVDDNVQQGWVKQEDGTFAPKTVQVEI